METLVEICFSLSLLTISKNVQYILFFIVSVIYFALTSLKFRYYLKHIFYVASMNCIAVLMIPAFILRPKNVKNLV